ncbi:hypothetical protein RF55_22949 [Lasius niger]|uniref:Ancillary SecYEG translocon subunit n=1 Tax=Lasius niger TaxID=67767 RepID=A0A0J7JWH3_LASNI|nr:hypothetical protein RF55_22949 [Lasius niger]
MAFDAYDYDDLEQSEHLKRWLRRYGSALALGMLLIVAAILGYGQWRRHQAAQTVRAASLYWQARQAELTHQASMADTLTRMLTKGYPDTAYAVFAAAAQARRLVQEKRYPQALTALHWAVTHSKDPSLQALFQLRSARVLLAEGEAGQALSALDSVTDPAYRGVGGELRGDAQLALGHSQQAREAYQAALDALGPDLPQSHVVRLKLDDLAVAGKPGT